MISQVMSAVGGPDVGSLLNMVPTPGYVTLIPVRDTGSVPIPSGPIYTAMFNPDSWDEKHQYQYSCKQEPGTNQAVQRFKAILSDQLNFNLIIDGTGASGVKKDVMLDILKLRATVGFNGNDHKTNVVYAVWGLFLFIGHVHTLDIKYKLFNPDGKPLRAEVSLGFTATTDPITRLLTSNTKSADLTHRRLVLDGDRLDNLCNGIYGAPRFLLEVAKANGLTSFRKLSVGKELIFPPLEK